MGNRTTKHSTVPPEETADYFKIHRNGVNVYEGYIRYHYKIGKRMEGNGSAAIHIAERPWHTIRNIKFVPIKGLYEGKVDRLIQEVRALGSIDHSNIIKVDEVYYDELNLSIVTEPCNGGELFDKIISKKFITENQAANYLLHMVYATAEMHSRGVVHLDLRPESFMFDTTEKYSKLKLIDFGTCKNFNKPIRMLERMINPYFTAPEVILGKYNAKCDVWSLGVIFYLMLSGIPPFNGKDYREILNSIMTSEPLFEGKVWKQVSPGAKDLITSMLTRKISARPSAQQVFDTPWLRAHGNKIAPDNKITKSSLKNLSSFYTTSKLHRAILSFIVSQVISSEEISAFREIFSRMDKNRNELISKKKLIKTIGGLGGDVAINVENVVSSMHEDRNGCINYTEILTAALDWEKEMSGERLRAAFRKFNGDGSGSISAKEFGMEALEKQRSQAHAFGQMVQEANANRNKKIDLEVFCNFMEKIKDSYRV